MNNQFSANLGFLWTELSLPDAVRAAAKAGFSAIELHWPYNVDAKELKSALDETGLPVLGLNTSRGALAAGDFGLSALPGREAEARAAIDQAIDYARIIGAKAIHVMAGKIDGDSIDARNSFVANLRYAADKAAPEAITILLEPLNSFDAPGYFLLDNAKAASIINEVARSNVRIMFDCYHMGRRGEPVMEEFVKHRDAIGHIQFAAVPDRGEPDSGEIDYATLLPQIAGAGYAGYFGAEYKPRTTTDAGLGWLAAWQQK